MNVTDLLRVDPRPAIVEPGGRSVTFAELKARVEAFAGGLFDLGLRPGDRTVVLVPMSIEFYVALLGVFRLGGTAILLDPSGPMAEKLARVRPSALVATPRAHLLRLVVPALRGLLVNVSTGFTPLPHIGFSTVLGPGPPPTSDAPALITFTTGTTDRPKAMARSHRFLLAQHAALAAHMDLDDRDIDLPTLPVFLLHSLASGATCILPDTDLRRPASVDPDRVIHQIRQHGVTTTSGSPAFFAPIARRLRETGETLPSLRRIDLGGARVPARLLADLAQVAPNAALYVLYGSTEAEPIAVLDARARLDELARAEAEGKGNLVGTPVPQIALRIVDDEVQVAGDHVNPGYLDDPEAEARTKIREPLPEGGVRTWHRTGDAGFVDDDGQLWLVGRVGEQVAGRWPLQVEGAAERLDFVQKAGLVALDGEAVIACELDDPPPDWASLVRQATGVRPIRVAAIPVDPRHNAKVDRAALARRLER